MSGAQQVVINLPGTGATLSKSQWDGCALYNCLNFNPDVFAGDINPLEVRPQSASPHTARIARKVCSLWMMDRFILGGYPG